jgi:hypothetical protein
MNLTNKKKAVVAAIFCFLWIINFLNAAALPTIYKEPFVVGGQFYDYQNYHRIPYFHGGIDLCAPRGTEIYAPVSGKISINTYIIDAGIDPHRFVYLKKPFKIGQVSNTRYLEISIIDSSGNNWMLRHVDPNSIPQKVRQLAHQNQSVEQGTIIGKVAAWHRPVLPEPPDYDHIHLEIVASNGVYLNPADFVQTNKDYYPPVIHHIFFVKHNSESAFNNAITTVISGKTDIIIMVNDRMNRAAYQHSIYSAKYSIEKIDSDSKKTFVIAPVIAYQFNALPFTGDRTNLSRVIYREQIVQNRRKYRANGNDGPRIFLLNLSAGTKDSGYNEFNCFDTTKFANGLYCLNVAINDMAGNQRKVSVEFRIKN